MGKAEVELKYSRTQELKNSRRTNGRPSAKAVHAVRACAQVAGSAGSTDKSGSCNFQPYVFDHGRVVANLESAKGFIEGWGFTRDGGHVVIKSRGAHGPATIELFPLRNGPPAESVQAYEKNLPDWAAPFADID